MIHERLCYMVTMVYGLVYFVKKATTARSKQTQAIGRNKCIYISVKHTANILRAARYVSVGMGMVMMQLGPSHANVAWLGSLRGCSHRVRTRGHRCSATRTSHVWGGMTCLHLLASVDFGHSPHSSAAQSGILVAIPPAVHCSLYQSSLSS